MRLGFAHPLEVEELGEHLDALLGEAGLGQPRPDVSRGREDTGRRAPGRAPEPGVLDPLVAVPVADERGAGQRRADARRQQHRGGAGVAWTTSGRNPASRVGSRAADEPTAGPMSMRR
ncbi:hypothetical protein [Halosegnis marinus]|uniref:hypothetical protein n=1 Tax=Halosegnis marinus TaxID=3034023 RepID=UPI003609AF81